MDSGTRTSGRWVTREKLTGIALVGLGVWAAILAYQAVHAITNVPVDFHVYHGGAIDVRAGIPIYSHSGFLYPPTAAVVFLPFAYLSVTTGSYLWLSIEVVALIIACVLAVRPADAATRIVAGVFVVLMLLSYVFTQDYIVGNLSVLLVPVAVGALLSFEQGRWRLGCALIFASLLLKPLLAPLLLLPLLRGRWRDLLLTGLPALGVLVAAIYTVPGGSQFWSMILRLLGGSRSIHQNILVNVSLLGLGDRLHSSAAFLPLRLLVLMVGLAAVIAWVRRGGWRDGSTVAVGAVVLLTVFLSGSVSEGHYLLIMVPVLVLALSYAQPKAAVIVAVIAFILMWIPVPQSWTTIGSPQGIQVRFVIAQMLMFVSAAAFLVRPQVLAASRLRLARGARAASQCDPGS